MGNVVGMDGQDIQQTKLTPEQQQKRWQVEEEHHKETLRLKLLQMAMQIENPGAYETAKIVATAEKLAAFVKQESKDEGQGTQIVETVAPGAV